MAILFKCKMCGGTIDFVQGESIGVCDSCGMKQTLPRTSDEKLANLFNRAANLRLKCEFDKAEQIYEKIVEIDDSEAEAHWGIVLCKFGIEYVEDPRTFERIPTCHRTLFDAITTDVDYLAAVDYADTSAQIMYEQEARKIDRIQKDILTIVRQEKPFDVFICYKETDENGKRTIDSTIGNDIYYQLTNEGYKVFYAPITLESKLGQEYEPYIFAALNSAKVMLVLGTKPEYFSAVWVKNEWARYLALMKTDRSRLLIPCYRDMDPYDLPEEFAHLQAQDMGKIGFLNDIIRGIGKILKPIKEENVKTKVVSEESPAPIDNSIAMVKRGNMALEDAEWKRADEFFEKALNLDAECAEAYLGKFLADKHFCSLDLWIKKEKEIKVSQSIFTAIDDIGQETIERYISEKVKENEIPGYLSETEIRTIYSQVDGCYNYSSARVSVEDELLRVQNLIRNDKTYCRAKKYAYGDLKKQIDENEKEVLSYWERILAEETENERKKRDEIKASFPSIMSLADHVVEKASDTKLKIIAKENEVKKYANEKNELRRKRNEYMDQINNYQKYSDELTDILENELPGWNRKRESAEYILKKTIPFSSKYKKARQTAESARKNCDGQIVQLQRRVAELSSWLDENSNLKDESEIEKIGAQIANIDKMIQEANANVDELKARTFKVEDLGEKTSDNTTT